MVLLLNDAHSACVKCSTIISRPQPLFCTFLHVGEKVTPDTDGVMLSVVLLATYVQSPELSREHSAHAASGRRQRIVAVISLVALRRAREAAYPVDSGSSICSGVGGSAPLRGLSRFMMSQSVSYTHLTLPTKA